MFAQRCAISEVTGQVTGTLSETLYVHMERMPYSCGGAESCNGSSVLRRSSYQLAQMASLDCEDA